VTCFSLSLQKIVLPTLWSLLLSALPVVVKTSDGEQIEGEFDGFGKSSLRLNQDGSMAEFPFDDLTSMRPADVESRTGPTFLVTLVSGSRVAAESLSSSDSDLLIEPRRQARLQVPFKQVKAIRFRTASPATDPQWLGMIEREQRGDTLVIRRDGGRLDPQQGVINSVKSNSVEFDLDGTVVDAPFDRLEGVIFGGTDPVQSDAAILVSDVFGSSWAVAAIEASEAEQPLRMQLSPSLRHELPIDQIESIRWSGGVRMLAAEEPAQRSFEPYLETAVDPALQFAFFAAVAESETDLRMHGGSAVEYRIEPGYQTFAGAVRRDDRVAKVSTLTVRIKLDGETVWEQDLKDPEPRGFELPLADARRLTLEVDSGDDGTLGDTVRFIRPRFQK
jgi:hypothetical protein